MIAENQCNVCHIGILALRYTTYARRIDNQLVLLPNLPVWVCDVCGEVIPEADTVGRIEMLFGLEHMHAEQAGRPDSRNNVMPMLVFASSRRWST